jgi:DNA adenine methylase
MHASSQPQPSVRPLLKWAGGKRQLLHTLGERYPDNFKRYFEPFFGSGAVFFDLLNRGLLAGRDVRLADVNPDLVGTYRTLRDHTEEVIAALDRLAAEYRARGVEAYYEVRDLRFNPWRASERGYTPELAAMLIFLNRTGFNGLFRQNRAGGFNVPAGRYTNPTICDPDHLRSVARAFKTPGVSIDLRAFEETLADAGNGDFVYLDPPYAPLSKTASFAHYTAGGFSHADQLRLLRAVIIACRRGAHVVLSNSSAPEIVNAYTSTEARAVGLKVDLVPARRAINSRASARGVVDEVILSNVQPVPSLAGVRPKMAKVAAPRKQRMA